MVVASDPLVGKTLRCLRVGGKLDRLLLLVSRNVDRMTIDLNSEQLAGVQAVDGDFVMIAVQKSGKTRVLVERYIQMRQA